MSFGKLVMAIIVAWIVIQCLPPVATIGLAILARFLGVKF